MGTVAATDGCYPGRAAIDAYGNGGFRFAGMSHRGSLLILPDRMCAWGVSSVADMSLASFASVLAELAVADPATSNRVPWFLLLGTGKVQVFPDADIRRAFIAARISLEVMDTGAAARTYTILLAEGRPVAAALIAV